MLPYLFKYDGAEIVFTGHGEFDIYVRNTFMESVMIDLESWKSVRIFKYNKKLKKNGYDKEKKWNCRKN